MSSYKKLKEYIQEMNYLADASATLQWDQNVNMPEDNSDYRDEQLTYLDNKLDTMSRDDKLIDLIDRSIAEHNGDFYPLSAEEILNLEHMQQSFHDLKKIPEELTKELSKYTVKGLALWEKAKYDPSQIPAYKANLNKIIEILHEQAKCFDMHTYDYCLDDFDEGATIAHLDPFFEQLGKDVNAILARANHDRKFDPTIMDTVGRTKLANLVMKRLGASDKWLKFGKTEHPYQLTAGPGDKRVALNYKEHVYDFYHTVGHEIGHATYEHSLPKMFPGTPISSALSFALHESQSLYFENHILKSPEFLLKLFDAEMIAKIYVNNSAIRKSLIRLDSDELTYQLHITIRYMVEKMLLSKEIDLDTVQDAWSDLYEKYLGMRPNSEKDGWLQDCHWSDGGFGYFPCYTIGHAIAAQLNDRIRHLLYTDQIDWLKNNFQKHGSLYITNDLLKKVTGEELQAKYLVDHLGRRFV